MAVAQAVAVTAAAHLVVADTGPADSTEKLPEPRSLRNSSCTPQSLIERVLLLSPLLVFTCLSRR